MVLDYLSGQDNGCRLRVVGNWYAMSSYGFGFPKQSKFKDMIDKELIEMHHSGEIERLRRFWFTGKNKNLHFNSSIHQIGACKSSMIQNPQRSSQPLDVRELVIFSLNEEKKISIKCFCLFPAKKFHIRFSSAVCWDCYCDDYFDV